MSFADELCTWNGEKMTIAKAAEIEGVSAAAMKRRIIMGRKSRNDLVDTAVPVKMPDGMIYDSQKEAAAAWGTTTRTIYNWIKKGKAERLEAID